MPKEELSLKADSLFNRVRDFMNSDNAELAPKDLKILERWKFAYDQLQIEKKHQTAIRLRKQFGVSESVAYTDIANAKKLFNPLNRHDVEFERIWLVNMIKDDILVAKKIQNVEKRTRLLERLYERFYKALGLDKDEIERIDPELLGNNKLVAVFQLNNQNININLDNSDNIKTDVKEKLLQSQFGDISIEDAKELLDDGNEDPINK